jgi:hypothetical protein
MKLLIEIVEDVTNEILTEEVSGRKRYMIEGPCIQTNVKNRNNRIYPKDVVKPEIDRYINEMVKQNKALGELNHPLNQPSVNYERASHKFESLTEQGDNWIGRAVVTRNTPCGGVVAGLMEEGVVMGISTRALGTTMLQENVRRVTGNFRMITAGDIVSDPSAPDAFLTNLMEGKEWAWANGVLVEQEADIKANINNLAKTGKLNEKTMVDVFNLILSKI